MTDPTRYQQILSQFKTRITLRDMLHPRSYASRDGVLFLALLTLGVVLIQIPILRMGTLNMVGPGASPHATGVLQNAGSRFPDSESLLQRVTSRALFAEMERPAPEVRPPPPKPQGPTLQDLVRELDLLGVIAGNPMEAMIESKRTRETYMLKPGDRFLDIEVVDVTSGQVTLRYNEETTVLR